MDGVTVGEFHANLETELDHIQDRLLRRRYHPLPLLQFQVPKNPEKMRTLCVPTVRDRVVQTATDLVTREVFEREFEDCSYAFAARSSRILRAKGLPAPSTLESIIATFAIEKRWTLLHDNPAYAPFEQHLGLKVPDLGRRISV